MSRPTRVYIDHTALLHNVEQVRRYAPGRQIIAMVKANAYGCGLSSVIPTLEGHVDAFGVACIEEAMVIRGLGSRSECILFQGIFSQDELQRVIELNLQCVVHNPQQLNWLLNTPLVKPVKVWLKINTGMHRLGFATHESEEVLRALSNCPWVDKDIRLMTHLANADDPDDAHNEIQLARFNAIHAVHRHRCSVANSAAIISLPSAHKDVVRPGLMLYGISPFSTQTATQLGLIPVMRLMSQVTSIHHYPAYAPIGYGGIWQSDKDSRIGVVPVGYGDGYPRHIAPNTPTYVNGQMAPIVGRVSMDMLTIDLTHCKDVHLGAPVELWGRHIPVENIAQASGTIAYELICQLSSRVRF